MFRLKNLIIIFTILILSTKNIISYSLAYNANISDINTQKEINYQCLKQLPYLVDKVRLSIVNVSVTRKVQKKNNIKNNNNIPNEVIERFFKQQNFKNENKKSKLSGSGFIISKKGHIITNYHVIKHAINIEITINGDQNKIYKAKILGKDPKTDLALIKINAQLANKFSFLNFANSDSLKVGEEIFVVGDSFGFQSSVSKGIISAKNRNLGQSFYTKFIQTDASINIGNSGGPMLNMNGYVVGVNTALASISGGNEGVGFAVPSNIVKHIVRTMIKNNGKIDRSWLGITFQPNTKDIANGLRVPTDKGAIVTNVMPNTPAEKGQIRKFDVITSFNGKEIKDVNNLPILVSETTPNKKIPIIILREGKKIELIIKLETKKQEKETKENKIYEKQGISVKNFNKNTKRKGVIVVNVKNSSEAYNKGLKKNDIILSINGIETNNIEEFQQKMESIEKDKNKNIAVLYINRNKYDFFLPITIEKS